MQIKFTSTKMQVTYHCGTLGIVAEATARKLQLQMHFLSEANQYYCQQDSHDGTPCTSLGFSHLQSHSIFRSNSETGHNQCTLILCIKVCSTRYRVCGSATRDKAYRLINKLVKYEDGTLSTEVIIIFKTVEKHCCVVFVVFGEDTVVFGEDRLRVKPGKTLEVGRQQMRF